MHKIRSILLVPGLNSNCTKKGEGPRRYSPEELLCIDTPTPISMQMQMRLSLRAHTGVENIYMSIRLPSYPFHWWGRRSQGLAEVHQNGDPDHQWKGYRMEKIGYVFFISYSYRPDASRVSRSTLSW